MHKDTCKERISRITLAESRIVADDVSRVKLLGGHLYTALSGHRALENLCAAHYAKRSYIRLVDFNPTCPECSQIRWALEAIASWIRDQKDVDLTLELSHREQCISYSGARENRPHVNLAIRGFFGDGELRSDLLVDIPSCNQPKDLDFSRCQGVIGVKRGLIQS
jgi:hypothetical protein